VPGRDAEENPLFERFRRRPRPTSAPTAHAWGLVPNGRYVTRLQGRVQEVIFIAQLGGEALVETAGGIRYTVAPDALTPVRGAR
jgi:hypothetical protein